MMKILVTGAGGQLGYDVVKELLFRGHSPVGSDVLPAPPSGLGAPYVTLDITAREAVLKAVADLRPDAVIHCAAWTDVDAAEDAENRDKVFFINGAATRSIAEACKAAGAKMLYISTDYVFDGQGDAPWQADDHCRAPLSVYGESKLEGELAAAETIQELFTVRVSWMFGLNGKNFVNTMLKAGKKHDAVRVVNDQIGTPTYTKDLARLLADMIKTDRYGYYHATNEGGYISWYDFAREIYRQAGMTTAVLPVTTAEYGVCKAARPFNSRLDKSKLPQNGFAPLPDWRDALGRYLREIGEI